MPNRLINEKSPYLLQHAHQPVDWYPWGSEAFEKAKQENKPIFLSIGYSTCHWCHVMAHESFDDHEVADILNRYFVSIKVDREERPDVDHVYTTYCQFMRGNCGWPLSVFMTPDKKPFFLGTYFPKKSRFGLEGFLDILQKTAYLWLHNRREVERTAESIFKVVQQSVENASAVKIGVFSKNLDSFASLAEPILHRAYRDLEQRFDPIWGGFSPAPKFPTPHQLRFLFRYYHRYGSDRALKMALRTLDAMASGGIYDQLAGGFHRYSVDHAWVVPHFEKMLYDQALIPMAYLEAWQLTKNPAYAEIVTRTIDFVLEELTSPGGGFYSAQDADVDGKEGEYYLWTKQEIMDVLGQADGLEACNYWGVEGEGNFEGKSILHRAFYRSRFLNSDDFTLSPTPENIVSFREKLLEFRKTRRRPSTDDKVITSWNGLMIALCARAGTAFANDCYVFAAERSAQFVLSQLMDAETCTLRRSYRDGAVTGVAVLEDYSFLVEGLLELFFATADSSYLKHAQHLTDRMISLFWDTEKKGFHFMPKTADELPMRSKDLFDGATPSGNSMAFEVLTVLDQVLGSGRYDEMAREMLDVFHPVISEAPIAYTHFLCGIDRLLRPLQEVVILPDKDRTLVSEVKEALTRLFMPATVHFVLNRDDSTLASLLGSELVSAADGEQATTMVQICSNRTCLKPLDARTFLERLEKDKGLGSRI